MPVVVNYWATQFIQHAEFDAFDGSPRLPAISDFRLIHPWGVSVRALLQESPARARRRLNAHIL